MLFRSPSPFCATVFLGSTSTFLLSSFRSSGVIILSAGTSSLPLPLFAALPLLLLLLLFCEVLCVWDEPDSALPVGCFRGAGKFCFLSTASTRRWNFLKRDSARMRVDSRSIVLESSLTNG